MATASALPSASSTPPTPPNSLPAFHRITSASVLRRNASNSSSRSNTTTESTSSLVAVPIRPPPIQTRTAATPEAQLPNSNSHGYSSDTDAPPCGMYGGRGFMHNGPRIGRQTSFPVTPAILTSIAPTGRSESEPPQTCGVSPTTPRASRLPLPGMDSIAAPVPHSPGQLRVSLGHLETDVEPAPPFRSNGNNGGGRNSVPTTPTTTRKRLGDDPRPTHSDKERRQSQASNHSSASAQKKPCLSNYILGEELGRGSYSTVVRAALAPSATRLSATPRAPPQFAIKIMNQAHLIQEKKAKYAHIERDALIRLGQARPHGSPTMRVGHRRGMSSTSSASTQRQSTNSATRRDSGTTTVGPMSPPTVRDRQLAPSSTNSSPVTATVPLSPLILTHNALSVSPDRGQEVLDERDERASTTSPKQGSDGHSSCSEPTVTVPSVTRNDDDTVRVPRTPRKRRQSLAPSEKSAKSTSGGGFRQHPGVIRLFVTFADQTSVYFVLELAAHGELASQIRKFGSLDLTCSRYYGAQLIDAIEFIHDCSIIHRDIKPENILLDEDMRLKVTDFGSAKILDRKEPASDGTSKRSFVGSADYVSPEVLRNEPATPASDIWAFGVVLFDFITGKSPFRSATEFLTFQRVLQRDITFPEGFDPEARDLIEKVLNLDPAQRPSVSEIKAHSFFASIDFASLWSIPAPQIQTGLSPPQRTQVNLDTDVWSVFDSEDVHEAEFVEEPHVVDHSREPQYDRHAAAQAVQSVDGAHAGEAPQTEQLDPPRRLWLEDDGSTPSPGPGPRANKPRGWSSSSSSSGGRLSGLLETMGINSGPFTPARGGSGRASRMSDRDGDGAASPRRSPRALSPESKSLNFGIANGDYSRVTHLLLPNERVVLSTPIVFRPGNAVSLPSFLVPASKRRQMVLTDLPRLLFVKDDGESEPRTKHEFLFLSHPHGLSGVERQRSNDSLPGKEGNLGYILEVQEKGSRAFVLQTATTSYTCMTDTPDIRSAWLHTLKRVV